MNVTLFLNVNVASFQALVEFFGTLSREWALDCMKDLLLVNLRGNLQIIVQVEYRLEAITNTTFSFGANRHLSMQTAKEYCEQLGVDACIKLFEQFKSYEGLYFFLGSYLSSRYTFFDNLDSLIQKRMILVVKLYAATSYFYFFAFCVVRILKSTSSTLKQLLKLGRLRR